MIDQSNIISRLILWIDSNIDNRLSVDDVAKNQDIQNGIYNGYSRLRLVRAWVNLSVNGSLLMLLRKCLLPTHQS